MRRSADTNRRRGRSRLPKCRSSSGHGPECVYRFSDDRGQAARLALGEPALEGDPEPREVRVARHFGRLGTFLALDVHASNAMTRELLGRQPEGPGLIADLQAGRYG
jgi:hypothetical protein